MDRRQAMGKAVRDCSKEYTTAMETFSAICDRLGSPDALALVEARPSDRVIQDVVCVAGQGESLLSAAAGIFNKGFNNTRVVIFDSRPVLSLFLDANRQGKGDSRSAWTMSDVFCRASERLRMLRRATSLVMEAIAGLEAVEVSAFPPRPKSDSALADFLHHPSSPRCRPPSQSIKPRRPRQRRGRARCELRLVHVVALSRTLCAMLTVSTRFAGARRVSEQWDGLQRGQTCLISTACHAVFESSDKSAKCLEATRLSLPVSPRRPLFTASKGRQHTVMYWIEIGVVDRKQERGPM